MQTWVNNWYSGSYEEAFPALPPPRRDCFGVSTRIGVCSLPMPRTLPLDEVEKRISPYQLGHTVNIRNISKQKKQTRNNGWDVPPMGQFPLKGGGDSPLDYSITENPMNKGSESSVSGTFHCHDCGKSFTLKRNLVKHKKHRCPKATGLTPIELQDRRNLALEEPIKEDKNNFELNSTTYTEDKEIEKFLDFIPDSYVKFRFCENPRNPMTLPGFWPLLFDYRGNISLAPIESKLGAKSSYKTLSTILTD